MTEEDDRRRREIGRGRIAEHEAYTATRRGPREEADIARDLDEIRKEVHELHHKVDPIGAGVRELLKGLSLSDEDRKSLDDLLVAGEALVKRLERLAAEN